VKDKNGNPKMIGFGTPGYNDYRSGTATEKMQKSYLARLRAIKKRDGSLAYKDKNSPAWFSYYYLWGGKE
jgi:hypothetical protein